MSKGYDLSDYVDVATREQALFERYPDARIQVHLDTVRDATGEIVAWKAEATIWRTPDDPIPVIDWAVEPVPGKTPYTRDSEAMNASTSAVGRAIILAGFPSKHVASANEVQARQDGPAEFQQGRNSSFSTPEGAATGGITDKQNKAIGAITTALVKAEKMTTDDLRFHMSATHGKTSRKELTSKEASEIIDWLKVKEAEAVPVAAESEAEQIPF